MVLQGEPAMAKGFAGCNRFSGGYQYAGNSLTLGPLASTKMACAVGMALETEFLGVLDDTRLFNIDGDTVDAAKRSANRHCDFCGRLPSLRGAGSQMHLQGGSMHIVQPPKFFFWALLAVLAGCGAPDAPPVASSLEALEAADKIFMNGKIITVDDNNPRASAVATPGRQDYLCG